jgi:transmembrane sensor
MSEVERALLEPEHENLGRLLTHELSEERARRMWRGIERRGEKRKPSFWSGALAAAAAFALVLVGWFAVRRHSDDGLLKLSSGENPALLESAIGSRAVTMTDGSAIEIGAGARLEVLRNDGSSFVTALRRGTTTFQVRPGGPRRWIVEAGLATVEVTGTRFSVQREPSFVRVRVEHGTVVVRSEGLPGGFTQLTAGKSVELGARAPAERAEPPISPPPPHEEQSNATPAPKPSSTPADGDAIDALLAAADAARRSGNSAAAIDHLQQVIARAPGHDPRRGMAALSLARLIMPSDPGRASRMLDESMADMPRGLAEDALARRVEAEARAGHTEKAAELAEQYLQRFPDGHRADDVRRWSRP